MQALFPESEQSKRARGFLEKSYGLFSEALYDEVQPGETSEASFDLEDESAPHYPLRINWNNRFQEFSPLLLSQGLFTEAEIEASFGNFFVGAFNILRGTNE